MDASQVLKVVTDNNGQGSTFAPLEAVTRVAGTRLNNDGAAIFVVPVMDSGGFVQAPLMLDDNSDSVAPIGSARYQATVSRLTCYDSLSNAWSRVCGLSDSSDNQAPEANPRTMGVVSRPQAYDPVDNTYNRLRVRAPGDESGIGNEAEAVSLDTLARNTVFQGAQGWRWWRAANIDTMGDIPIAGVPLVTGAGEWTEVDAPAANTAASATRAGDAINTFVIKSITVTLACAANQGPLLAELTSNGVVKWTGRIAALANTSAAITLAGLNIMCEVGEDATLTVAQPAATNFVTAAFSGITVAD